MFVQKDANLVLKEVYAALGREVSGVVVSGKVTVDIQENGQVLATIQETFRPGDDDGAPSLAVSETNLPAS